MSCVILLRTASRLACALLLALSSRHRREIRYVRRSHAAAPRRATCEDALLPPRFTIELRSIDAIVAMVSAGLGVAVVPQPRKALLDACGVEERRLGRRVPTRQISAVWRRADADSRNLDAIFRALAEAYARSEDDRS